jgi:UDP-N-acetylmuramate: L-alanyl-gamma-D-glutamyl-meso-diaminopimelate ligase
MNLESVRKIYLIGICGTAMASFAGLLKEKGYEVCGSDSNVYPPMSTQLQTMGITLLNGYRPENLVSANPDLVIPGNAIPRGNVELEQLLNSRMPYLSMTEVIKEFFLREKQSIVIAGTHGKTTTSSLAAWMLQSAGMEPSYLIGGMPLNFSNSYQWNPRSTHFVIEGDEYDTGFMDRRPKFVNYLPETVILNPVEFDHADLYPDLAAVENAFWQLVKIVPSNGTIIVNRDNETAFHLVKRGYSRISAFGFHADSDYRIDLKLWSGGEAVFAINDETYRFRTFGKHNVANATAVAVLAKSLGLGPKEIQRGFDTFQGVKRRMELRGEVNGIAVYDDFAHHPTAIASTLEGVRLSFPDARIWGVFEPRSWSSRRNVFQTDFERCFSAADLALIAPVFEPEKLAPEVRLDPRKLVKNISDSGTPAKYFESNDVLLEFIAANAQSGDKIILMSNGSFEGIHERVLRSLEHGKEEIESNPVNRN